MKVLFSMFSFKLIQLIKNILSDSLITTLAIDICYSTEWMWQIFHSTWAVRCLPAFTRVGYTQNCNVGAKVSVDPGLIQVVNPGAWLYLQVLPRIQRSCQPRKNSSVAHVIEEGCLHFIWVAKAFLLSLMPGSSNSPNPPPTSTLLSLQPGTSFHPAKPTMEAGGGDGWAGN